MHYGLLKTCTIAADRVPISFALARIGCVLLPIDTETAFRLACGTT